MTVMCGNTSRFSGTSAMPLATMSCGARPAISSPPSRIDPRRALRIPLVVSISVVLPAPFGPRRQVIEPCATASVTPRSASILP